MNSTVKLGIVSFLCTIAILVLIIGGYLYLHHRQTSKYEGAWKLFQTSSDNHEETVKLLDFDNGIFVISKVDDVRYTVDPVENDEDAHKETWTAIKRSDGLLTFDDGHGGSFEVSIDAPTGHLLVKSTDQQFPGWAEYERY